MDYIALIHKDENSDYGVSFPDFPGCISAASTIEEAKEMAKEALSGHIECMIQMKEDIPCPGSIEFIMKERENKDAIAFLVSVPSHNEKAVRVNITLSKSLLKEADRYAKSNDMTRSGLIAEGLSNIINR